MRPPPRKTGAEWLVGVGFRCWLAGYDTGDIACWETGWNAYARVLGTERAKRAVTELACWVRAVRASASRKIEYYPFGCAGFCADECMAISLIAASQHHRCPAMRACALALTGSSLVEPVIDAANAFADALQEADQCLSPEAVAALAAPVDEGPAGTSPDAPQLRHAASKSRAPPHRAGPLESGNLAWSVAALHHLADRALLPIIAIFVLALQSSGDTWPHLIANVLPGALRRTLALMAGVGALTLLIGTGTAWLVTMYRFPGRRLFQWLLLLPLAIPTYIIAYCYPRAVRLFRRAADRACARLFGWHERQGLLVPRHQERRWRHLRDEHGALPLRLHHRAGELPRAVGLRARSEPHARAERRGDLLARWRCRWRGRRLPPAWRSR